MRRLAPIKQSYRLRSRPVSAQRAVNLMAQSEPPDAKVPVSLLSVPGLATFATAGSGPIRGLAVMSDVLYAVSGTTAYSITSAGVATGLGSIGGSGRVDLADNGSQLVAVDSAGDGYVVTSSGVTALTDTDFLSASSVTYLDGYHIFSRTGTGQFFISDLLDADSFDALDIATAESSPDPLVRAFVDHRELWLFGSHSIEVWINTGAAAFPFERQAGSILEKGCAAAGSVAKLDNTIFWLGEDRIVYRAQGYTPQRVSHHAVEQALTDATAANIAAAHALTWSLDGHACYALTVTGAGTHVFDVSTGVWHERDSRSAGVSLERWRAQGSVRAYGKVLVGDDTTGVIYALDPSVYTEGSEALVRTAESPPIHADGSWAFMSRVQLDMETGIGLNSGQGSSPMVMMQYSDDGGQTWSSERWASAGQIGQYTWRVVWHRLGRFRSRVLRFSVSDPVPITLMGILADYEVGL
jgi:hypothetical protein